MLRSLYEEQTLTLVNLRQAVARYHELLLMVLAANGGSIAVSTNFDTENENLTIDFEFDDDGTVVLSSPAFRKDEDASGDSPDDPEDSEE
jgi:hypothetical protein